MGKDLKGKELGKGFSQRSNGSYCARFIDRFGKRRSLYHKDLRVLRKQYNDSIYENNHELSIIDENITLTEWFSTWLFSYKLNYIRENTKTYYSRLFTKHIQQYMGELKLNKITKLNCTQLLNIAKKNGLQWESQNKIKILLSDMFDKAVDDCYMKKNPMKGIRLPSNKPKDERRVLTREEQALFFECSAGTFYDNLFVVAINTGLRPGEIYALTKEDIDFDKKEIHVNKTLVYQKYLDDDKKTFHLEDPKTFTSTRNVPINNACERALKKQFIQKQIIESKNIKQVEFSDRLFTTKFNTPLNAQILCDAISRVVREINLMKDPLEQIEDFSGHCFRHTFATRCIESNIQPKILQKYLGHATLQMTMDLYVHVTDEYKKEEMTKLEETLEGISVGDETIDEEFRKSIEKSKKIVPIISKKMA